MRRLSFGTLAGLSFPMPVSGGMDNRWRFPLKRSTAKAILTDSHFWIPFVVLGLGVALLVYLH